MKIATSSQMQKIDQMTIENTGIPGDVLMENAGRGTADILLGVLSDLSGKFIVACGPGNNGGDGFVISRYLFNHGCDVDIVLVGKQSAVKGSSKIFFEVAKNLGIPVHECDQNNRTAISRLLNSSDVIVDALFGTGITRPVDGLFKFVVDAINSSDSFVCSVDIPSGLSSDSCVPIGPTVQADITVSFGLPKPALVLYPSAIHAGQIFVSDISIPQANITAMRLPGKILTPDAFPAFLLPRKQDSHKGQHGHLLIIAGSPGKTGAAIMSSQAAARSGAGLITTAVPSPLNSILETRLTEVMTLPLPGDSPCFCAKHVDRLLQEISDKQALLVGPGMGTDPATVKFLADLLPNVKIPLLLDADALNTISFKTKPPWNNNVTPILTPHPGEFSRLSGLAVDAIISDPIQSASDYASRYSCIVVLKSARTIIAFPDGTYSINVTGNPGLASGGSGDILSGLVSGLMAQGISPDQAASAGVFWQGFTADIIAKCQMQQSTIATDLLAWISKARLTIFENPECFSGCMIPFDYQCLRTDHG
jgi:ADP-dependent NAD(P)H-hydrate dehydratase / NAD(P)H-hydrate epimerase